MLAIALLVIGIARVIVGVYGEYMPDWLRALNIGGGLLAIVITFANVLYTQNITQTLIQLLSIALLIHGTISALIGRFVETLPRLLRGLCVIIGLLNIALSTLAFVSTPLGFLTSIHTLSIGYLSTGIIEIILGILVIRRSRNDDTLDAINSMVQKEL
jgi:hypothetical protein